MSTAHASGSRPATLLRFFHGLGDAAQFTVVLKHLRRLRPGEDFDVVSGRGKHSAFHGLCRAAYFDGQARPDEGSYRHVQEVWWYENYNGYTDRPNSKITNCLAEEFGLPYHPDLGRYEIHPSDAARARARAYLASVGARLDADGKFHALVLHYEGNTSTEKKNLGHEHARAVCTSAVAAGAKVILLDWDARSPIPDGVNVLCPRPAPGDIWGGFGSGDAETVAALVGACRAFVGIDSGPGKCATATDTPCVIVWTGHHPLQFHDPADNVTHLVPEHHAGQVSGDPRRAAYFATMYRHQTYRAGRLGAELHALTTKLVGGSMPDVHPGDANLVRYGDLWVRQDNFDQDLVIVNDVLTGDCYRTSLYDLTQWETVVDVGAHIGTFAKLVHHMNPACRIVCVEACPENLPALRANVGSFATVIHGAMTYEPGDLALLNAVRPNCESTGGSVVVSRAALADPAHPLRQHSYQYWDDLRPLRKVSLGEAMAEGGISHVSCLKLDCEGAEYSILEHAPEMDRVRFVFGEYHEAARWNDLRARKMADWPYGLLYTDDQNGRGLFHLVNPRYNPRAPLPDAPVPAQSSEPTAPAEEWPRREGEHDYEMHNALRRAVRAAVGHKAAPVIVETGVRGGDSALAYFDVCPGAAVTGYDAYVDPDSPAMRARAERQLAGKNFTLVIGDTNKLDAFPRCDLLFIDGDHSFAGCWFDLMRGAVAAPLLIVDDYHPDHPEHPVTKAVRWFLLNAPPVWTFTEIAVCGRARVAVLDRRGGATPPEFGAPNGGVLKIALGAGVGDTAWVVAKLPAVLARLGARACDLFTCEDARSNPYLAALPFVRSVNTVAHRIVEWAPRALPTGEYNYAPSQPGWHHQFDLFLQANGHLEGGHRLETWFPHLPIDWAAPVSHVERLDDGAFADGFAARGPFVTLFAGPLDGNTTAGHNVGGRWTPKDWTAVARALLRQGVRVVLVGAGPGDQEYAMKCLYPAGFFDTGAEDCIGLWALPRTLAVLKRAAGHVGYQSGLGVLSVYHGQPACMFWQEKGVPINDTGATFDEGMATAWVPPAALAAGRFFGAIYGRDDARAVIDFITTRVTPRSL